MLSLDLHQANRLSINLDLPDRPSLSTDGPEIVRGDEKMSYTSFYKKYYTFRSSQIERPGMDVLDSIELPYGSMIHVLDNFDNKNKGIITSDIPNLALPYIQNDRTRKYIYHVKAPFVNQKNKSKIYPVGEPDTYIYRTIQLAQNLMKFKAKNNSRYRDIDNINSIPKENSVLVIINHNPVFRTMFRGVTPTFRSFNIIFSSILNVATLLPETKEQFIFIPLAPEIYNRDKFIMAEQKLNLSTLKAINSYHYLFMVNWMNFISSTAKPGLSLLSQYPVEKQDKLTFVLHYGNYAIFYKLNDLVKLNTRNTAYNRLLNQINKLVVLGMSKDAECSDAAKAAIQKLPESIKTDTAKDSTASATVVTEEEQQVKDAQDETDIENVYNTLTKNNTIHEVTVHETAIPDDDDAVTQTYETPEYPVPEFDSVASMPEITTSNTTVASVATTTTTTTVLDTVAQKLHSAEPTETVYAEKSILTLVNADNHVSEIKPITPLTTSKEVTEIGTAFIEELDTETETYIDKTHTLTPKQKERVKTLAKQYKSISLNGKTLTSILTAPVDPNIEDKSVPDLDNYLPDKSMVQSSISDIDRQYMEEFYYKDLVSIAVSFNKHGMFLTDINETVEVTEVSKVKKYRLNYEDINGKKHHTDFSVPYINEDGTCLVNNVKSYFKKQLINLTICKISETRVSLASSYNKTIVERNTAKAHNFLAYFQRVINSINSEEPKITLTYGRTDMRRIRVGYEYAAIAGVYRTLSFVNDDASGTITLTFDYHHRFKDLSDNVQNKLKTHETTYGIYVGNRDGAEPVYYFMTLDSTIVAVDARTDTPLGRNSIIDLLITKFGVKLSSRLTEWTDIKILDKRFPVIFLLCYKYGLRNTIEHLNANVTIYPAKVKFKSKITDVVIPFLDKTIVVPRYPLKVSFLFAGFTMFETKDYALEEFDDPNVYYQLLVDKGSGYKTNYLKGIDDTFMLFVDPSLHTRACLKQMGEPATFRDLLIRATDMLTIETHKEAASMSNHRVRSFERINSILYNEMARQFGSYKRKQGAGAVFSINPNAVFQRILQDQAMCNVDEINPIHDIKTTTGVTYTGVGGRTQEAFTIPDRRYPTDGVGMLSEATPDSGNVAITATLSMNPKLVDKYGFIGTKDDSAYINSLEPTNILSVTSLLMPGVTQDDGKRANFCNVQMSHTMPTKQADSMRIRTGYERVIAQRCSDLYAYSARRPGKVLDVDDTLKMVKIEYDDKSTHTFSYGLEFGACSDLIVPQRKELTIKKGDTFKKNDILCYNPQYFERTANERQVDYMTGVVATVAIIDTANTFEDSSVITTQLGEKLEIEPIQMRSITITKNTIVHKATALGTKVDINDYLMIFETDEPNVDTSEAQSDDTINYLAKLNRVTPRAKFTGTVVKIETYYGCPINEMHPTLAKVVRSIIKQQTDRSKYSAGTNTADEYIQSKPIDSGNKVKGVKMEEDTVVINYYIQESLIAGIGDKIILDSSLKSVVSEVVSDPMVTESGRPIDSLFSGTSISNRIICSPLIVGIGEQLIEQIETDIVAMYFTTK